MTYFPIHPLFGALSLGPPRVHGEDGASRANGGAAEVLLRAKFRRTRHLLVICGGVCGPGI